MKPITKEKLLLVEGDDEENLFEQLLIELGLTDLIEIMPVGGVTKFDNKLKSLKDVSGFNHVNSIGIVRDADSDARAAFQSITNVLTTNGFEPPDQQLVPSRGQPRIAILILPYGKDKGMLEDVCLESVRDDIALGCVDDYFECLKHHHRELSENAIPKARVRTFLASREWLEIAHFECLQECVRLNNPIPPQSPAEVITRVHTFLASRYSPDLDLGVAAKKSNREDRYWDLDNPVFNSIKEFLTRI